jgi:putative membrane protein
MEALLELELMKTAAYYSVSLLALIVFLAIFETVTKYKNWEEIKKGNIAVALATGGKIFGVANIFRHSIEYSDSLLMMLGWGVLGFVLLLFSYFIFEFLTPSFKVDEEIARDNRAVGFIAMIISIGLSYVIGASIISR